MQDIGSGVASTIWTRLLPFALPAAVVTGFAVLLARSGMTVDTPAPWPRWSFVDFRDTLWLPARDLAAGFDPYDLPRYLARHPQAQEFSLYAPGILVIGAPVAALPWPVAMPVWGLALLVAFVVLVHRSCRIAGVGTTTHWFPVALAVVLVSPPGNQAASSGQYAVISAAAAVVALSSRGPWTGAIATALALVKPQVGVPLLVLLLVDRRWRTAVYGSALAAIVSAPPALRLMADAGGPTAWVGLLRQNLVLTQDSPVTSAARAGSTRVDVVGSLQRLGVALTGTQITVLTIGTAIAVIAVALICRWTRTQDAGSHSATVLWWAAVAGVMLLWTPNELYAALVALPAVLAGIRLLSGTGFRDVGVRPAALPGVLLAVPFLHVHRIDAAVGIGEYTAAVNGAAILVATAVAAVSAAARLPPVAAVRPALPRRASS